MEVSIWNGERQFVTRQECTPFSTYDTTLEPYMRIDVNGLALETTNYWVNNGKLAKLEIRFDLRQLWALGIYL